MFHPAAAHGVLPSENSPRRNRAPLSRSLAPLRLSTSVPDAVLRALPVGFPDSHARAQSPGSPADYGLPFHPARRPRFPFTLGTGHRGRPLTQLSPPRSLVPPGSPFTSTEVAPRDRPLLSWLSALLELLPLEPRRLCPPEPRGPNTSPPPKGQVCDLRGPTRCRSTAPTPGVRWGLTTQNAAPTPSVDSSPVWTDPRRLSTTRLLS